MTTSYRHLREAPSSELDDRIITLLPWHMRRESLDKASRTRGESAAPLTVADVMTRDVASVSTVTPVSEIANVLTNRRISTVPVVCAKGNLAGIVSESDLIRRVEIGTQRKRSWWRRILADIETEAIDYVRTHGRKARHVMTSRVVTATEDMTLAHVADILEARNLKRLPVVRGKRLVGIVSRSDFVKALAQHRAPLFADPPADDAILRDLMERVKAVTPSHRFVNASVYRGNVDIVGFVDNAAEREAILVAVENTPGVRSVQDRLALRTKLMS